MRALTSILTIVFIVQLFGQTNTPIDHYEVAYQEIVDMLEGKTEYDFKRAVFLTENAFWEGELKYEEFDADIKTISQLVYTLSKVYDPFFEYEGIDRQDVLLSAMIYKLWTDTVYINLPDSTSAVHLPFSYDFQDPFGHNEWIQMFVTKLIYTTSGNCHSMPYLYKIIADEIGIHAYLAVAPNHLYIKQYCEQLGMYNTELTSAQFPIDAWLMASGYIHLDAIRNGIYMDTLTNSHSLSICLFDLAKNYEREFGISPNGFISKCVESALKFYPNNINALLLKSELLNAEFEEYIMSNKVDYPNEIMLATEANDVFELYQKQIAEIHQLGYRKMPERMYNDWLLLLQQKREEYSDTRMDNYLNN